MLFQSMHYLAITLVWPSSKRYAQRMLKSSPFLNRGNSLKDLYNHLYYLNSLFPLASIDGGLKGLERAASLNVMVDCRVKLFAIRQMISPFLFQGDNLGGERPPGQLDCTPKSTAFAEAVQSLISLVNPLIQFAGLLVELTFQQSELKRVLTS